MKLTKTMTMDQKYKHVCKYKLKLKRNRSLFAFIINVGEIKLTKYVKLQNNSALYTVELL